MLLGTKQIKTFDFKNIKLSFTEYKHTVMHKGAQIQQDNLLVGLKYFVCYIHNPDMVKPQGPGEAKPFWCVVPHFSKVWRI